MYYQKIYHGMHHSTQVKFHKCETKIHINNFLCSSCIYRCVYSVLCASCLTDYDCLTSETVFPKMLENWKQWSLQ